jgi:surface antigen
MIKIISFTRAIIFGRRNHLPERAIVCAKTKETTMIGKLLGGIVGAKAAEGTAVGGAGGALLGAATGTFLRRASIPTLLAVTVGGYALKKWKDRHDAEEARRKSFETPPAGAAI